MTSSNTKTASTSYPMKAVCLRAGMDVARFEGGPIRRIASIGENITQRTIVVTFTDGRHSSTHPDSLFQVHEGIRAQERR